MQAAAVWEKGGGKGHTHRYHGGRGLDFQQHAQADGEDQRAGEGHAQQQAAVCVWEGEAGEGGL